MELIENFETLSEAVERIHASKWAAVDTEADSLHHYIEKLCLVQISIPEKDYVIDPLIWLDLEPLVKALHHKPLIFHGADFDIRMVRKVSVFSPKEIFDTMIAAQLLGYPKQSLADLVERHCGIVLSKSSQKADWSRRPLTEKMLDYAAKDTHFLKTVSDAMRIELDTLGRLDWHRQSCERALKGALITREERSEGERATAWQVKGSKAMRGKALTILKELWHWREKEAQRRDRPPFKVLNTDTLLEIAQWAGSQPDAVDVGLMPNAIRPLKQEYREGLNRILKEADSLPQAAFWQAPKPTNRPKWGEPENKKLLLLKAEREKIGKELNIHPSLLATNAILEALILAKPQTRAALLSLDPLLPWQVDLIADSFLKIVSS